MSIPNTIPGQAFRGAEAYRGGTRYVLLTAAQSTTPLLVKNGGGRLAAVTNPQAAAQTEAISFYDSADAVNYASTGTLIYTITPGATTSQRNPTPIDIPFTQGLIAVAAGAVTGNVLIQVV